MSKSNSNISQKSASDVHPSVMSKKRLKRQTKVEFKKSLQTPLTADNKGYQLLMKMGYKPGQSLGMPLGAGKDNAEPLPISIKVGRSGLGQETALREKRADKQRPPAVPTQLNKQQKLNEHSPKPKLPKTPATKTLTNTPPMGDNASIKGKPKPYRRRVVGGKKQRQ